MNDIPSSVSIYKAEFDNDESYYPQNTHYKYKRHGDYITYPTGNDVYFDSKIDWLIHGYLKDLIKDNHDYSFIFAIIDLFLRDGCSNCAIYPKFSLMTQERIIIFM